MVDAVFFPGGEGGDVALLGGKGAALVRLAAAGFPVPPGAVLTTRFFAPWFELLTRDPVWRAVVTASPVDWDPLCREAKSAALGLPLAEAQRRTLGAVRERLGSGLFAVRSSSPEEDLEGASFAGGYETRLGVSMVDLEGAVRACFVSCLDARVLHYKAEQGFDPAVPRIAVAVQEQLAARVAGVAFSMNPRTNDYDEAVIDASWGLGEAVVAGLTSPDHFVVDRVGGEIVERIVGAKELSIWLGPDGGTERSTGYRSEEACLDEDQVAALVALVGRVEELFGRPVDIEWAVADGALWLLQARPVTAYLPLPPELITEPGERRRLYMDASLSNGLTLNVPVSPLGLDWLEEVFLQLLERFVGPLDRTALVPDSLYICAGGRMYANLSHLLWVQTPAMLERSNKGIDALMAATLGAIDARRYRSRRPPPGLGLSAVLMIPRAMWAARRLVGRMLLTLIAPEAAQRRYLDDIARFEAVLREEPSSELTFEQTMQQGFDQLMDQAFAALWSSLGAFGIGLFAVEALTRKFDRTLAMKLQQGFVGNVVVEMGGELYRLGTLLPDEAFDDIDALAEQIADRDLSESFLSGWDAFHERFGARGPIEMDLASPRYRDDPMLALRQIAAMRSGPDPATTNARLVRERDAASVAINAQSGWLRRWLLRRPNRLLGLFSGPRDTPKHVLTLYNYQLRKKALALGERFVNEGRLDEAAHIFDLRLRQLDAGRTDVELDLRALRAENVAFLEPLRRRKSLCFPPVIDSRGRMIRPPRAAEAPGELRGMGVAPGVARGRVRRLYSPDARGIEPGEVLVAYTTDPGWTPLFVNAAAVVLGIGGTLQHGALVAREYGKPCVVGISELMERLEDGELVEVDGTQGVVRRVSGS